MHGLMNNTKWRELLTIISAYPVYIQLKLVKEIDFHIDQERADWVISDLDNDHFTYVKRVITYQQIDKLKIQGQPKPKELDDEKYQELLGKIKKLIFNNIEYVDDSLVVNGYQISICTREAKP